MKFARLTIAGSLVLFYLFVGVCVALTPKERKIVQHAISELKAGIQASGILRKELEGAKGTIALAQDEAQRAKDSAEQTAVKAAKAEKQANDMHGELVKCESQNARMKDIVDKVTGPWWFPGLNALIYGVKKSVLSLIVIIAIVVAIGFALKIFAPGALTAIRLAGKAVTGFGGTALKSAKRLLPKRKPKPKE